MSKVGYEISVPINSAEELVKTLVIMNKCGCSVQDYPLHEVLSMLDVTSWGSLTMRAPVTKVTVKVRRPENVDWFKREYLTVFPFKTITVTMERSVQRRRYA